MKDRRAFRVLPAVATAVLVIASIASMPRAAEPVVSSGHILDGASIPYDVQASFERACQDCHSNNTRWPWYSRVYPMSVLISRDVQSGRAFMNLSQWSSYKTGRKLGYLQALAGVAADGSMPPKSYGMLHPEASLSAQDWLSISEWARAEQGRLRKIAAASAHPVPQSNTSAPGHSAVLSSAPLLSTP